MIADNFILNQFSDRSKVETNFKVKTSIEIYIFIYIIVYCLLIFAIIN